ncbi:MAG: 4-cresol dehydrogenase [hydroxylating] flavoprotein subunit [Alphaproteobacteria bacterium MarineAlpha2_Bin1]|nr:MAG: 4-cresol dehydrogenase [hydroxylating] flavoprotein subunit [Alphaproteobacteria bacterium MarineAlpha2_Bin1]
MNSNKYNINIKEFEELLGKDNVLIDEKDLAIFSRDIIEWEAPLPLLVIKPATTSEVSKSVQIAFKQKIHIAPRGGGLSYTKGYVPNKKNTVMIDLKRLDKVLDINREDLYVTVEAGCTWKNLTDTLKPLNMRPAMTGPISGIHSTIGGGASQNIPGSMDAILGMEIVLADGRVIFTGSSSCIRSNSPFYRNYGPDLTGIFLGDTGSYGIKTKITLRIERIPEGVSFASYSFTNLKNMARAMAEVARLGVASKTFGMDPLKNRNSTKIDFDEGIDTLKEVVKNNSSVISGLKNAFKVATATKKNLEYTPWSLHLTVEGFDQGSSEKAMNSVLSICEKYNGTQIEATIPLALRARPYSIRGFLGIQGERWVPVHALFPLSRTDEVVDKVEGFFSSNKKRLEEFEITHSFISSINGSFWLLEPMFYWFDEVSEYHLQYLEKHKHKKLARSKKNLATRNEVIALRKELSNLFFELGSINAQIGKFYNFAESLHPETYKVLTEFKKTLDPQNLLNPGNLGWK